MLKALKDLLLAILEVIVMILLAIFEFVKVFVWLITGSVIILILFLIIGIPAAPAISIFILGTIIYWIFQCYKQNSKIK